MLSCVSDYTLSIHFFAFWNNFDFFALALKICGFMSDSSMIVLFVYMLAFVLHLSTGKASYQDGKDKEYSCSISEQFLQLYLCSPCKWNCYIKE